MPKNEISFRRKTGWNGIILSDNVKGIKKVRHSLNHHLEKKTCENIKIECNVFRGQYKVKTRGKWLVNVVNPGIQAQWARCWGYAEILF